MNIIPAYLKRTWHSLLLLAAVCCLVSSCDNMVYDGEGDCSVPPVPPATPATYCVKFRYDKNLKWADAFAHEVKSVHLYAFDMEGTLVWHRSERGDALAADDYAMTLDVPAGDYRLVAWCGLDNDGERAESFTVPEVREGVTRIEQLKCSLNRMRDASGGAYSDGRLYPLFHGMRDVKLPADDNGGSYTYTMELTKDTNHIRVILQNLSGEEVRAEDFTYRIEEENGLMNYDNKLLPDEIITYWPKLSAGSASLGFDDYPELGKRSQSAAAPQSRAVLVVNVAVADFFIGRLVPGRRTFLRINEARSGNNELVADISITDFALMLKDGYYGDDMTDEDYLDRQDEYELVLFLDERRQWIGTSIIINSWKIVRNNIDFGE